MKLPALAALAAVLLAGCTAPSPPKVPPLPSGDPTVATTAPSPPEGLVAVVAYTVPPRVTGHQLPACVARGGGILPDPACTPGSVGSTDPSDKTGVCVPGFESAHRPSSTLVPKRAAMAAYHLVDGDLGRTEYDHLIPLGLGGSNDVTNLWPQVSDLPGQGFRNSKDNVELRAWRAVCTGDPAHRLNLAQVQRQFATDWRFALPPI